MPPASKNSRSNNVERQQAAEQALIAATNHLVAAGNSFTEISVDQLARKAGMSRSTFYVYFRDKGDLVGRISAQMTTELVAASSCWIPYAELAVWADVRQAVQNIMAVYERHGALMAALIETAAYDAEVEQLSRQMMARFVDQITVGYDRIKAVGKHHPNGSSDVAKVLPFMLERCCYHYCPGHKLGRAPAQYSWLADTLTHVLWSSLYSPEVCPDPAAPATLQLPPI